MPPKRRTAHTQNVDLAAQMNELRQMMLAQQQEIAPVNQPAAPETPDVYPVIPENPIAPEVPMAHVAVPLVPLVRAPEELYDKFRCMKAPEFEGSTNPIEADNWLIDLQVILNFLRLNDQEKVLCASFVLRKDARLWWETVQIRRDVTQMTWEDFVEEFKEKYFNIKIMEAQQDEFNNFRQGNLSVSEAVKKTENNGLSSLKIRRKKKPKSSRIRQDQTRLPSKEVKEDLLVKAATISNTAIINKRGNGIQEDRGINRILPKRRMLLITTVIPLVRYVGGSTREIAMLEPIAAFCVARKATMLGTATLIFRIRRTIKEVRDINFTQNR
ncbi:hypothetical protein TIFTF001_037937 [Ficus carica]|uniref:Retrotransposon gag domain-containing protein n=1 Tax=Ficus carica TaxID=3494 RepID=A0AA88JCM0_FICCA|nr:hypothetical protein TIFTF001_037937 [Ficus carica]